MALRNDLDFDRKIHESSILPPFLNLPLVTTEVFCLVRKYSYDLQQFWRPCLKKISDILCFNYARRYKDTADDQFTKLQDIYYLYLWSICLVKLPSTRLTGYSKHSQTIIPFPLQEFSERLHATLAQNPPQNPTPEAIDMVVGVGRLQEYLVRWECLLYS